MEGRREPVRLGRGWPFGPFGMYSYSSSLEFFSFWYSHKLRSLYLLRSMLFRSLPAVKLEDCVDPFSWQLSVVSCELVNFYNSERRLSLGDSLSI